MTDSDRIAALERRVAELEKQANHAMINPPTFFTQYKYEQYPASPIPIRTDEVTCTGEKNV